MKKILKTLTFFNSLILITFNSMLLTGCSLFGTTDLTREDYVSMLNHNIPGEHEFIAKCEKMITNKASAISINNFNNLYDSDRIGTVWENYESLQKDLITTKMGNKNSDVNWDNLYKQVGLSNQEKAQAEKAQLRFYNIMSKIYGKTVITKLIQKVEQIPINDSSVIAWTKYHPQSDNLRMGYGSDFVNTNLINQQYQQGYWSSNNIITVSTQEIGHALNLFLSLDNKSRMNFNDDWRWDSISLTKSSNAIFETKYKNSLSKKYSDVSNNYCVEQLMQYLDDKSKINFSNPKERELFPLIVVRSNYGRAYWFQEDHNIPKYKLFTEAFAQWILTPQELRNWNWELLNDFFMYYLPEKLKS